MRLLSANLKLMLKRPPEEVAWAYLQAHAERPTRAEALHYLAKFHEQREEYALALIYARTAAMTPRPPDVLPIDTRIYEWAAWDEMLCCARVAGADADARIAARQLLGRRIPESDYERIHENVRLTLGEQG